ncbi:MAG: PorP/SprF family type IX secretion system membrane protein [Saprospiraceae bacterium]
MYFKNYIFLPFFLFISNALMAQDLHFSQYYHHPLYQNPALTGAMAEDFRVHAIYRSQWSSVPVPYRTFISSFDTKLFTPRLKNTRVGVGGFLNTDRSGDSNFTTVQLGASGSYGRMLQRGQWLSIGAQAYVNNHSLQPENLTFDEQFNGESFDESIAVTEIFERRNNTTLDVAVGINYHFDTKNTIANVGLSYVNFFKSAQPFLNRGTTAQLPKVNAYSGGRVWLSKLQGYSCGAFFSLQGLGETEFVYRETVIHAGWMYRLKRKDRADYILHPGLHWRVGESLIPHLELTYENWRVMLSYDITISDFRVATQRRGGVEIGLRYVWKRVIPPPKSKACPVF